MTSKAPSPRARLFIFLVCAGAGTFLLLLGLDRLPSMNAQKQAPDTIIALCGFVFIAAGCMAAVGQGSRVNDLLAGLLCLAFAAIAAWVSFFSTSDGFSGGVPFLPRESNVKLARVVFGFSAAICLAISIWAFRRFFSKKAVR